MTSTTAFRFLFQLVPRTLVMLLMLVPTFAQTPNPTKPSIPPFSLGLELLTDPQAVDLKPYMSTVYKTIRAKALETLPPSVANGDQGLISIKLRIQKDGTVAGPTCSDVCG